VKRVILFAYLHCSKELDEYKEYIVGQFAGTDPSQHSRILNLDRAICLHESQLNLLLLTSFNSYSDLITNHLISPQMNTGCQTSNKCAKNVVDLDAPICR